MSYRLGIDVGGTNTDAAVVDGSDGVVATAKVPTTGDVTGGIVDVLEAVLASEVPPEAIDHVMLGTTHCTNAVTERERLANVAAVRVGAPATTGVPPLYEWDDDLREAVGDHATVVRGGYEYDGRPIADLDEAELRAFLGEVGADVDAVAVTGVFSPVRDDQEHRVGAVVEEELGELPVSLSSRIGSIGLLDRENATVLNAGLNDVIAAAVRAFRTALDHHDVDATLYIGQNDGTVMSVDDAEAYPIFTVASGPANSVRGAAALSDIREGIIVDVGGTTTDVGALAEGFPRESAAAVEIGGVTTNFRMPDLHSVGIGGGSIVHTDPVRVGPDSVGYRLTEESRVFGGDTLTATDVAVARGRADIGTHDPEVDPAVAEAAEASILEEIERVVDRMRTGPEPVPVAVVGGGSILVPDDIAGASRVVRPDHHDVANAVGAAIAQVSGSVDRVVSLAETGREAAVDAAKAEARKHAIAAGGHPDTVELVDLEEVPLSYLPGDAVRIRAKAAADLRSAVGRSTDA